MERTLFVFEGEDREKKYFQSLRRAFFNEEDDHVLVCFQNDIYELYQQLSNDADLDPFELIRELNPVIRCQEKLVNLRRDQIGQIYLFFDMEPCDDKYDSAKLLSMLELFSNETEHGKLFVSYPMVEALRDIDDHAEYLNRVVDLHDCTGKKYKRLSAERGGKMYQDARKIDKKLWQDLITVNVKKANGLASGEYIVRPMLDPLKTAHAQIDDYLPDGEVSVLSAFPIFLVDYFGEKVYSF